MITHLNLILVQSFRDPHPVTHTTFSMSFRWLNYNDYKPHRTLPHENFLESYSKNYTSRK